MASPVQDFNHVEEALAQLPQQFSQTLTDTAQVTAFGNQIQELEDALFDLLTLKSIANSVGAQLDLLGVLLNVKRGAYTDTQYRGLLSAQILINKSSGTIPQMLAILVAMLSGFSANGIQVTEYHPCTILFRIKDALVDLAPTTIFNALMQAKQAGDRIILQWSSFPDSEAFTFDSGPGFDIGHLAGVMG